MMKSTKYAAMIALATCLSHGAVVAEVSAAQTPNPPTKTAAQQLKDHQEQQKKEAAAKKAAQLKVTNKLKEQALEKKEHEADHRKALVTMRARHTEERKALTATNKKAMDDLIAKQEAEIASASQEHEEHMTQVTAQHEAAAQKKIAKHLGS